MKIFIILLLSLLPIVCPAQNIRVYYVKGTVTVKNGGLQVAVSPGQSLKVSNVLDIPADARIVVLLESKKELHSIDGPESDRVGNLIKREGHSIQQLSESYLSFIKQKITKSGIQKEINYKQSAGSSYRDADSLLFQVLIPDTAQADTNKK